MLITSKSPELVFKPVFEDYGVPPFWNFALRHYFQIAGETCVYFMISQISPTDKPILPLNHFFSPLKKKLPEYSFKFYSLGPAWCLIFS